MTPVAEDMLATSACRHDSGTTVNQATCFGGRSIEGRRFSMTTKNRKSFISQRLRNARRLSLGSRGVVEISCGGIGGWLLVMMATAASSNVEGEAASMGRIGHSNPRLTAMNATPAEVAVSQPTRFTSIHNNSGASTTGNSFAPTPRANATAAAIASPHRRRRCSRFVTIADTANETASIARHVASESKCPLLAISFTTSGHQP